LKREGETFHNEIEALNFTLGRVYEDRARLEIKEMQAKENSQICESEVLSLRDANRQLKCKLLNSEVELEMLSMVK